MTSGFSGSPAETACRSRGRCAFESASSFAIMRYSVGAWQSTVTPRRSSSESRCSGSKAPSWTTTSAPCDHGPRRTFQIDFAQPVPAVHHTTSCSCASSQWPAWARCAHVYACVCTTPFGSFVVPEV